MILKNLLCFSHLKFLYLQSLTVSTGSVTCKTVHDQIWVQFIKIWFEKVILSGLSKIRAVACWNKVFNWLLQFIINLSHKLNCVWCAAVKWAVNWNQRDHLKTSLMHKCFKLSLMIKLSWAVQTYRWATKKSRHDAESLKLFKNSVRKLVSWLLFTVIWVVNLLNDSLLFLSSWVMLSWHFWCLIKKPIIDDQQGYQESFTLD